MAHRRHREPHITPASHQLKAEVEQHFSLRKIAYLLNEYVPPPANGFNPAGHWNHRYTMYILEGRAARYAGEFSLKRTPRGAGQFVFTTMTQRVGQSGYSQFQHGEFQCQTDSLATPLSWVYDTKMARHAGDQALLNTGKRRQGKVSNGTLSLRDSWRTRKIPLSGAYTNEWTLLEAVQRLSAKAGQKYNYTLIDEYDAPQPGHTLAYRGKAKVALRHGHAVLTAYDDIGNAVVPTTYWLDEHHRLLFVCTGLMVYALNNSNGHSGICPKSYKSWWRLR